MKKIIKTFLKYSLSICLIISSFGFNLKKVNAVEEDLSQYIIGGTGTFDDPYILFGNSTYKEMFDNVAKEAVQPTVIPAVDFSGTLTGTSYYNQTNGGIWNYTHGGPGTSSDYALVILGISYVNNADTQKLSAVLNNSSQLSVLTSHLKAGLAGAALTAALKGAFGTTMAGVIGNIFLYAIDSAAAVDKNVVNQALSINGGILEISYKTSYHGSWYYTSCLDVWRTYPTAKTPGSAYGEGVYKSK